MDIHITCIQDVARDGIVVTATTILIAIADLIGTITTHISLSGFMDIDIADAGIGIDRLIDSILLHAWSIF